MLLFKKNFNIKTFLEKAKKLDPFDMKPYEEIVDYCKANARNVPLKTFGLRLVVISDTHGDLAFGNVFRDFMKQVKRYDFVIVLGDIYAEELTKITEIIPAERIVALRGNHDRFDVYERFGIRNLNGKICTYKNVRFAGIEGSFRYKKENFPSYTQYESLVLAHKMPSDADVLLSHDRMFTQHTHDMAHVGLAGITYYIYQNAVSVHIHGHIHKPYQKVLENGTIEKSVYGCEVVEI